MLLPIFGAAQVGTVHCTPVKLLIVNPAFAHRLHGFPERSSARSLSLIAPVFALGPSLVAEVASAVERDGSLRGY